MSPFKVAVYVMHQHRLLRRGGRVQSLDVHDSARGCVGVSTTGEARAVPTAANNILSKNIEKKMLTSISVLMCQPNCDNTGFESQHV